MIIRTATIQNEQGIHCRPSAEIIKVVSPFEGTVEVESPEGICDPRSILALMSLGLEVGTEITLRVEGEGEETMAEQLVEMFERHFDFPPRGTEDAESSSPLSASPHSGSTD